MKLGYAFVWVEDAEKAVQFYEEAFGFERRSLTDNGELGLYAEMETGATTLAIADQKEARVLFPDGFPENNAAQAPGAFQISFVTPDVKASYEATLQAGATKTAEPQTQPWGQAIARVRDLSGVLVSIAGPFPSGER
jgi:uncharacterized glyoxalase superfamily protein PhnB